MRILLKSLPLLVRRRRHRGSVLILVVVMVVLLALLGTALLSTSRGDRLTSTQHVVHTQIDLLVEGVKQLAGAKIDNSLMGFEYPGGTTSVLRPPVSTANPPVAGDYADYDAIRNDAVPGNQILNHDWLSARAPAVSTVGVNYRAHWLSIGTWLAGSSFESPFVWDSAGGINTSVKPSFTDRTNVPVAPGLNFNFTPTAMKLPSDGKYYPAFQSGLPAPNNNYYMAADADGDGIADSAYFRLPVGTIDGLDYYAAYRIVDANSAINLNTAWSRSGDHLAGTQAVNDPAQPGGICGTLGELLTDAADNLGWFQSHVGLQELLNRSDQFVAGGMISTPYTFGGGGNWNNEANASTEMLALDRARFGYDSTAMMGLAATDSIMFDLSPLHDQTRTGTDKGAAAPGRMAGSVFFTQGDALQQQLANRLRNPGRAETTTANNFTLFKGFGISDALTLAYHGGLMTNPELGLTPLESVFFNARSISAVPAGMKDSVYSSAANYRTSGSPTISNGLSDNAKSYGAEQGRQWTTDYYNSDATGARNIFDPQTNAFVNVPAGSFTCVRPFLTTWSPTSNLTASNNALPSPLPTGMTAPHVGVAKVSVNTGAFGDLWAAFFKVMADRPIGSSDPDVIGSTFSPFGALPNYATQSDLYNGMRFNANPGATPPYPALTVTTDTQRMFRSSIRDSRIAGAPVYFSGTSQMLLRSALASVQTLQLRNTSVTANKSPATPPVNQTISLRAANTLTPNKLQVRVFGTTPQPFITEVFIQTDANYDPGTGRNPQGYSAIELYNPFDIAIDLDDTYDIVTIDRNVGTYPLTVSAPIFTFPPAGNPGVITLLPQHYALIENYNATGGNGATHRPAGSGLPSTGSLSGGHGPANPNASFANVTSSGVSTTLFDGTVAVDLSQAYNRELIIRRKMVAAPTQLLDYCPIDIFDMSIGPPVQQPVADPTNPGGPLVSQARDYHYCRASGPSNNNNWRCVYPGRYNGADPLNSAFNPIQGFDRTATPWNTSPAADNDVWANGGTPPEVPSAPIALGNEDATPSWSNTATPPDVKDTYTIPLGGGNGSPGPFPIPNAPANRFPYGGFAREADMLQIPFIGSYTVVDDTGGLYEMNSVSMDSAFAEDSDPMDDEVYNNGVANGMSRKDAAGLPVSSEVIGHFCPVIDPTDARNDVDLAGSYAANSWNYRWATKLFDYLTVTSPQNDYLPNVDSTIVGGIANAQPVDNDGDGVSNGTQVAIPAPIENTEDACPRQGLININTAPWQVLAALPMLKTGNNNSLDPQPAKKGTWDAGIQGTGDQAVDDNVKLAKAIVLYRDGDSITGAVPNGPFKSIFDLYRVPEFRGASNLILDTPLGTNGIDRQQGDFTVANANNGNDFARYDYKERFMFLNRISNLITTKSDSYIVYILVEGWRDPGTTKAKREVVRRVAMIQDRWGRTARAPLNTPYVIPND